MDTTTTTRDAMVARLASHRALGHAPAAEHAWLAEHGTLRTYPAGTLVTAKGAQSRDLLIVLSGHLVIRLDRGAGEHKVFEWRGGDLGGAMPYSRGASPPNDVVADAATEVIAIPLALFPSVIRECPVSTAAMVHTMIDRARQFTTNDLHDEKLVSLGKLAAGLAHELNNPASAVMRGAKLLTESLDVSEDAARRLGAARLSDEQLAMIDELREMCLKAAPTVTRSTLGRSDREDELVDWLNDHGADERWAGPLAETGVTTEALDELAHIVEGDVLTATIAWMSAGCNVRTLAGEIQSAAERIHQLVGAIKGFTYMDHAQTAEPVDIRQGIMDTLAVLGGKCRSKNVQCTLSLADELPLTVGVGAELNQIWMNLIDNALDAVSSEGRIEIRAAQELDRVVVRIADNGPGIPAELQTRIFEPFFTTKGVGKGTGLGLDIARRMLTRHNGEIALESAPGRTEFQVRLPIAPGTRRSSTPASVARQQASLDSCEPRP